MDAQNGFRLQPVLDFKSSVVDMLEMELARLRAAHQQEQDILLTLQQAESQEREALFRQQQEGLLDCDAIRRRQQYLQALDNRLTQQTARVDEAKDRMESKRNELVEGMKDQKALEKLHTRHQAQQARELSRREARTVDDMLITRYARKK